MIHEVAWDQVELTPNVVNVLARVEAGGEPMRVLAYEFQGDACGSASRPVRFTVEAHGVGEPVVLDEFYFPAFGGRCLYPLQGRGKLIPADYSLVVKATYEHHARVCGHVRIARD